MPAIRPEAVSNCIRLSNEVRTSPGGLVAESSAVDALLSAVVDELSPSEHGVGVFCSQNNLLSGADELSALAAIGVSVAAVMPLIEFEAVKISILS